MRNFDIRKEWDEADAQYELRGQVFTRRPKVRPETLALIEDAPYALTSMAVVEALDQGIRDFLVPEDVPRWDALRGKPLPKIINDDGSEETPADPHADLRALTDNDPVSLREMRELAEWLVEVETRLPTESPSTSTGGQKPTEPTLTAASTSEEATRAA